MIVVSDYINLYVINMISSFFLYVTFAMSSYQPCYIVKIVTCLFALQLLSMTSSWCVPVCICALKVDLGRRQEVVVYDQSTKDAGQLSKDSFVHILLSKLDGTFHRVSLLTGTEHHHFLILKLGNWSAVEVWSAGEIGACWFWFIPADGDSYITDSQTHSCFMLSFPHIYFTRFCLSLSFNFPFGSVLSDRFFLLSVQMNHQRPWWFMLCADRHFCYVII